MNFNKNLYKIRFVLDDRQDTIGSPVNPGEGSQWLGGFFHLVLPPTPSGGVLYNIVLNII